MIKKKELSHAYVDRDLSWMYFNHRILEEASKNTVPLLERINFLGIYSNNLDEYYRVRMATLTRLLECEEKGLRIEQDKAKKLVKKISKLAKQYASEFEEQAKIITEELKSENIFILKEDELDQDQQDFVRSFYFQKMSGFVGVVWFSSLKHLSLETDDNLYLSIKMRQCTKRNYDYALITLPVRECGRFISLPNKDGKSYLMYLDDVIRFCLPLIFSGITCESYEAYEFKFTKDAEMDLDHDMHSGVLERISKGVKNRRKGEAIRVVYDMNMPKDLLKKVVTKLNISEQDSLLAGGKYHNYKDLMSFPDCGRPDLKYPLWKPLILPELRSTDSLLERIQNRDCAIHVPYQSFDYLIRVLQEASISKEVKSIQITLYRLAKDSKVVKSLICAARNGKKVTVVIELLARFDESMNIDWSQIMQEAGIHVIFGVEGLKVHSKIIHISMKHGRDIACISTGNFHEGNARAYTDYILMTSSPTIVKDIHNVFTFIERPYSMLTFKELLVSPNEMKNKFIKLINDEIRNKLAGKPAYIRMKINHITEETMVRKLYEASSYGIPIDIVVRGNCSLITGKKGISDTISACGIIDRYLEHSRIFIFAAGGENKTFIGSADWMPRNLDHRIEVVTPVYDPSIKEDLWRVIDYGLKDNCQSTIVDGSGLNVPKTTESEERFRSQEELYIYYKEKNQQQQ